MWIGFVLDSASATAALGVICTIGLLDRSIRTDPFTDNPGLWQWFSRPQPDALTNSEAFLAGISSCGVTLIETHAQETGIPLTRIDVTIEGVRTAAEPTRFAGMTMTFELAGVSATQAAELVETYRGR